ncbi:hypothetical protein [Streptomyces sp. bgisy032]|uniref:hypothetical protein n=1 Tax=Streptomyces sp. bgisy032 TaxID=3413773 RepID=UPI003D735AC7
MAKAKALWTAAATVTAGAVLAITARGRTTRRPAAGERWLTVTVNVDPAAIHEKLPAPLCEYGDSIETRILPAPGDRGTELAVRLREPQPQVTHSVPARIAGQDPRAPCATPSRCWRWARCSNPTHRPPPETPRAESHSVRSAAAPAGRECCESLVLGVFAGAVDKFSLGAVINKGLTLRGAQQHGRRYIPMLLGRLAAGELSTSHLATHTVSLDEAPRAYEMFKDKSDGCVRAVIRPGG